MGVEVGELVAEDLIELTAEVTEFAADEAAALMEEMAEDAELFKELSTELPED